jgi:hypothetical protein
MEPRKKRLKSSREIEQDNNAMVEDPIIESSQHETEEIAHSVGTTLKQQEQLYDCILQIC